MDEQADSSGYQALVSDDGQWYDWGAFVHLERWPSGPSGYRLVPDVDGDRQVVACRRATLRGWPMLVVSLRRIGR